MATQCLLRECNRHCLPLKSGELALTMHSDLDRLSSRINASASRSDRWFPALNRMSVLRAKQRFEKMKLQWFRHRSVALRLLAVLGAMVAVGCSSLGGISKDSPVEAKKERAGQRAQARWDALIRGDVNAAYEFLSPGTRAVTSQAVYKG